MQTAEIWTMQLTSDKLAFTLERAGKGDITAFITLYHATSKKLFGIVVRILGRGPLAEDVLQDVYLRVWQRAGDYDATRASAITWLATIARNRALDETRRRKPMSLEDLPELLELPGDTDIIGEHLQSDEMRRLRACLDRLKPDQRELLQLIYFEGRTREAVATQRSESVSTVKTWIRRSLAELKGCLEP